MAFEYQNINLNPIYRFQCVGASNLRRIFNNRKKYYYD